MTLPIKPVVKPSTLVGQTNGQLNVALLTLVGVGSGVMELTAARAFRAMFNAARVAGFVIREVGDYRTFNEQINLFWSRYKPVTQGVYSTTPSAHRRYWAMAPQYGYTSAYWIKKDFNSASVATPGTSNHGWGLALDIAEEYDTDPEPDGIRQIFVDWLCVNADRYGICAELQSEKWHWRYYLGDAVPQAVLDYEANIPPPPPPEPVPEPEPEPEPPTGDRVISVTAEMTEVKFGSESADVKRLQCLLKYFYGQAMITVIDGKFGNQTKEALINVQRALGLTADAICGPQTWKKMLELP
jgi:peptidoglycan hydrolase-like protein with peptidoglycan-binding domain